MSASIWRWSLDAEAALPWRSPSIPCQHLYKASCNCIQQHQVSYACSLDWIKTFFSFSHYCWFQLANGRKEVVSLLLKVICFILFFFFKFILAALGHHHSARAQELCWACAILVHQPGIEPTCPALGARTPIHWATSESLWYALFRVCVVYWRKK